MAKRKGFISSIFGAANEDQPHEKKDHYRQPKIGRPRMYETPEEMQVVIDEYFETCDKDNPPTLTALALYLGYVDRQSLYDNENREGFTCTIKKAKSKIAAFAENQLMTRDKPTGAIFWLKNAGWSDNKKIEHSGNIGINMTDILESGDNDNSK